jgi:hypothetical protein
LSTSWEFTIASRHHERADRPVRRRHHLVLAALRWLPLVGPFVRHLQIVGIDLGLYVESFIQPVGRAEEGTGKFRYVFLDVDRDACPTLFGNDPACARTAPADRRVVAKLVRAARENGALVVVVDIAAGWPGPVGSDPLAEALTMPVVSPHGLTPVVLPMLFDFGVQSNDAGGRTGFAVRPLPELSGPPDPGPEAGLYFGLPLGSSGADALSGDVIRAYARSIQADAMKAGTGPRPFWTLAGIAACLAVHRDDEVHACQNAPTATSPEWIRFSVPPMLPQPDGDPRAERVRSDWRARYLAASNELAREGDTFAAGRVLDGAIVIVGSSRDNRDYHTTPLGPMTGAEIVLNAIRSFLEFPVVGEAGLLLSLFEELPVLFLTAVAFAAFWWLVSYVAEARPAPRRPLRRAALHVAGFFLVCVVTVVVSFLLVLSAIALQRTSHWDVVSPVLGTALEGGVEGLHVLIVSVEAAIAGALAIVVRPFGRRSAKQQVD